MRGGQVDIQSQAGQGTRVTVLLPAGKPVSTLRGMRSEADWRGAETVLVVEDDELVRRSVYEILRQRGYQVLEARDVQEAWQRASELSGHLDLLLTDLVLPSGSGTEVAEAIREKHPEMRVLYMSGYTESARVRQLTAAGYPFCSKPFTAATLARKLREVLAETVASAG